MGLVLVFSVDWTGGAGVREIWTRAGEGEDSEVCVFVDDIVRNELCSW